METMSVFTLLEANSRGNSRIKSRTLAKSTCHITVHSYSRRGPSLPWSPYREPQHRYQGGNQNPWPCALPYP
jgi:hypothetical protein